MSEPLLHTFSHHMDALIVIVYLDPQCIIVIFYIAS